MRFVQRFFKKYDRKIEKYLVAITTMIIKKKNIKRLNIWQK